MHCNPLYVVKIRIKNIQINYFLERIDKVLQYNLQMIMKVAYALTKPPRVFRYYCYTFWPFAQVIMVLRSSMI